MKKAILFLILSTSLGLHAQVGINNTSPKATLDITASDATNPSETDGILVPRIDTFPSTNPGTDQNGMLVFLTTTVGANTPGFYYWEQASSSWVAIGSNLGNGDTLEDADGDTKVQVEESADDDTIRFDIAGTEEIVITKTGDGSPHFNLDGTSVNIGNGISTGGNPFNVIIGNNAGTVMSGAQQNVVVGSGAGADITGGDFNTLLGFQAGHSLTTGKENTLLGFSAGSNNTTGIRNVIIGRAAGENATGSSNIFIGNGAGRNETGDNKLYIDNQNTTSPLIYGEFDNNLLRVNGTLDINNVYQFPMVDGTSGQVLTTDGAGTISWQTQNTSLIDTDGDTQIQVEESADDDTIRFDAAGTEAAVITSYERGAIGLATSDPRSSIHISDGSASSKTVNDLFGYGAALQITDNSIPRIYFEEAGQSTDKKLMDISLINQRLRVGSLNDAGSAWDVQNILVMERDGDVGVGVANPQEKFHVNGSIRMVDGNETAGYVMTSDVNGTASWAAPATVSLLEDADGDTQIQVEESADEDIIRFDVAGSERMTLADGNSAIETISGLTNPSGVLELDGYAINIKNTSGGVQTLSIQGELPGGVYPYAKLDLRNLDSNSANTIYTGASIRSHNDGYADDGDLRFYTTDNQVLSEQFRITSTGNLGVGETNPQEKLHVLGNIRMVDGNETAGYVMTSDANGTASWAAPATVSVLEDADGDTKIQVEESADEDILRFDTDGAERMVVLSNGNVGIGINVPNYLLEVDGNTRLNNNVFFGTAGARLSGNNQGGSLELGPSNSAGGETPFIDFHFGVGASEDYNFRIINDADHQLSFRYNNFYPLRLNASGIEIGQNYTLPYTDGTNAQVLSTNGAGVASWQTIQGISDYGTQTVTPAGGATGIITATIAFGASFTVAPNVTLTLQSGNATEMYAINVVSVSTTDVTIAIYRIDNGGGSFNGPLDINWMAIAN